MSIKISYKISRTYIAYVVILIHDILHSFQYAHRYNGPNCSWGCLGFRVSVASMYYIKAIYDLSNV